MTIAVDIRTGAVIGQVLSVEHSRYVHCIAVLTKNGPRWVLRSSVRVEKVN